MKTIHYIWITLAFTVSTMSLSAFAGYPNQYNVAWDSPSRDSFGSMPLPGSRGAGANVWVSEGSLWIYLAHNGAYDEQGRLLKLGCVRLTPTGADWGNPVSFQQTQTIADGTIGIASTCRDGTRLTVRLRFLGESLLVDTAASRPLAWTVAYGTWRDSPKKAKLDWFTGPEELGADTVSVVNGKMRFDHRNGASIREQALAEQQRVPV